MRIEITNIKALREALNNLSDNEIASVEIKLEPAVEMKELPCPFCGGESLHKTRAGWISCRTCNATGPTSSSNFEWNNRSGEL